MRSPFLTLGRRCVSAFCAAAGLKSYTVQLQRLLVDDHGADATETVAVRVLSPREKVVYNNVVAIPFVALEDGGTYQWLVQVDDDAGCGSFVARSPTFLVDSVAPDGESVSVTTVGIVDRGAKLSSGLVTCTRSMDDIAVVFNGKNGRWATKNRVVELPAHM